MNMSLVKLEDLVSLTKRRGFIYPGSSIYGGLSGTWDYGPLGVKLKDNLLSSWKDFFVDSRIDMYMVDAAILMNKKVWQASGHVDTFSDPLVECRNCHNRFRADKIDLKKCPTCGFLDSFTDKRDFNLMFSTKIGPVENIIDKENNSDDESLIYLRPETAQGIFTNYKNIIDSFYPDIPFGIAQHGKAFRNEISPRDFIFRSREFEQLEIEYFVNPDEWTEKFELWISLIKQWFSIIGLNSKNIHEHEIESSERAHYSKRTIDFEFDFPIGREELMGLAYRADFDLSNIERLSKKSMIYKPKDGKPGFVPHVIEPSFGVERLIMAVLSSAYKIDEINGESRIYLDLPILLAPVKVVVGPLVKNNQLLVDKSKEVFELIRKDIKDVVWDDNGNIGKRYRRADEIGTPYCVTIDFNTLEDGSVTLRERNTTKQKRLDFKTLVDHIKNK